MSMWYHTLENERDNKPARPYFDENIKVQKISSRNRTENTLGELTR